MYTSSDSVMIDNKNKRKKKMKQYRTKNVIKNECAF